MPPKLAQILETLEELYGPQKLAGPTDPYEMIVFLNCGYPASDGKCAKGFEVLKSEIGTEPNKALGRFKAEACKVDGAKRNRARSMRESTEGNRPRSKERI